jgi:amidohydrolase
LYPDLIQFRRNLHREPETAWQEFKTTRKIKEFLEKKGLNRLTYPLETGLVAEIVYNENNPYLGLRADIDALPVIDEKEVEYRSIHPGICHACGHDVHTTVVCGVAAVLSYLKLKLPYNLRFIFQPAEEPIPSGAPKLIEKGVLKNILTIWAMHVDPLFPLGTISLTEGWVNTQSIKLEWQITGVAGHSARPELAKNPISGVSHLIQEMQNLVDELETDKDNLKILAFTKIASSLSSYNTIPQKVNLIATLRLNSESLLEQIISQINHHCTKLGKKAGLEINFDFVSGAPPVINDPTIIRKFEANLSGEDSLEYRILHDIRSRGGDDFGWYAKAIPGALIRFGTAPESNSPLLHTSRFDVPEDLIAQAILLFIIQILKW